MKKIIFGLLFLLIFLKPVFAFEKKNVFKNEIKPTVDQINQKIREEFKKRINQSTLSGERKEIKNQIKEENKEIINNNIKNQIKERLQNLKFPARMKGRITEIGEKYLKIIDEKGLNYLVNITEKTQLRRRFWGKANFSEFKAGNEVLIIGQFTNQEKNTIEAFLIKNLSVEKRWGVFFGQVMTVSQNYLVIKTDKLGNLSVYYQNAKLINREEKPISLEEIQVGHRVRVKGVWDGDLKEIREVNEIKDFSIPLKLSPTARP